MNYHSDLLVLHNGGASPAWLRRLGGKPAENGTGVAIAVKQLEFGAHQDPARNLGLLACGHSERVGLWIL